MDCVDDAVAEALVSGQLPPEQADALQAHIQGCELCEMRVSMARESVEGSTDTSDVDGDVDPDEPDLAKGTSLGRYLVLDRLGAGGMGVVYLAYDPELDRRVAIKLMRALVSASMSPSQGQTRLLREAQAMAKVSHPNVIAVHDVGTFNERVFAAMELVEGEDLRKHLKGKHTWREVVSLYVQAGRGLAGAHAAGMVHRDFKPDNVLIGKDGRVRVTDFGLARLASDAAEPEAEPLPEEAATDGGPTGEPSVFGKVAGTPGYMAPEQYLGAVPDARSDQFSFCVALYEGLYGERPFSDEVVQHAATQLSRERTGETATPKTQRMSPRSAARVAPLRHIAREPPKQTQVPGWVHKIVLRGLRIKPEDRFDSMQALLSQLEKDPARARKKWLTTGAVGTVMVALATFAVRAKQEHDQLCKGAQAELTGTWDKAMQDKIQRAFQATGRSYATTAWTQAKGQLDAHAGAWVAMHTEACEATHVRGTQSPTLLDLRMACLGRRLSELQALAEVLATADGQVVEHAVQAVGNLTPLAGCADVEALTARIRPPEDAALRAKVEALRKRMDQAKALEDSGKYTDGLSIAEAAGKDALVLPYRPIQAEAYYRLGQLRLMAGYGKEAEAELSQAAWLAEASRYEEIVARSVTSLVFAVGYHQARPDAALVWAHRAEAALEAASDKGFYTAHLHNNLGAVHLAKGDYKRAIEEYTKGLEIREKILKPDHVDVLISLLNLGEAYLKSGDHDRCRDVLTRALKITEDVLGQQHPIAGFALNYLGVLYTKQGRYADALASLQRAAPILEGSLGAGTHYFAAFRMDLANVYMGMAQPKQAETELRAALAIQEKAFGPARAELAPTLLGLAEALLAQGGRAGAAAAIERALRVMPAGAESEAERQRANQLLQLARRPGPPAPRADR